MKLVMRKRTNPLPALRLAFVLLLITDLQVATVALAQSSESAGRSLRLVLVPRTVFLVAGSTQSMKVEVQDKSGRPAPQDFTATFSLDTDSPAGLFIVNGKHQSYVSISEGASSADFSYFDVRAGRWTVKATLGNSTTTATIIVRSAAAFRFEVSVLNPNVTAGAIIRVNVTAVDTYGNQATSYNGTIEMSFHDASGIVNSRQVEIPSGSGGRKVFEVHLEKALEHLLVVVVDSHTPSLRGDSSDRLFSVVPAPAACITIVSGNNQTGIKERLLPEKFIAKVTDRYGNAVPGFMLSWILVTSPKGCTNARLAFSMNETDPFGTACSWLLVGSKAGTYEVLVLGQGVGSVKFTAEGREHPFYSMVPSSAIVNITQTSTGIVKVRVVPFGDFRSSVRVDIVSKTQGMEFACSPACRGVPPFEFDLVISVSRVVRPDTYRIELLGESEEGESRPAAFTVRVVEAGVSHMFLAGATVVVLIAVLGIAIATFHFPRRTASQVCERHL